MRDGGLCKANVDAVVTAPREYDARRLSGCRICDICQRPPILGNGNWWQQ
jgi:hypothetical protein